MSNVKRLTKLRLIEAEKKKGSNKLSTSSKDKHDSKDLKIRYPTSKEEKLAILREIATKAEHKVSVEGDIYAIVKEKDGQKLIKIGTQHYYDWIIIEYEKRTGSVDLPKSLVNQVISFYEAQAKCKGATCDICVRVGIDVDGAFYHDLADKVGSVVKITSSGWSIETDVSNMIFDRTSGVLPLVLPTDNRETPLKYFHRIGKYLNLPKSQQLLFKLYALFLLVPGMKYPVLNMFGEKRSGKGTASRLITKLVDPLPPENDGQILEKNTQDVFISCKHRHLIIFDNVARLTNAQSDILCNIQSGARISKRKLHTDKDVSTVSLRRAVGINSTSNPVWREDLADRSLMLEFGGTVKNAKSDAVMEIEMERDAIKIRSAMYGIVSAAMGIIDDFVDTKTEFRCADYVMWGRAFCRVLRIKECVFLKAVEENVNLQNSEFVEDDGIMQLILSFTASWVNGTTSTMTATEWQKALKDYCKSSGLNGSVLEKQGQSFSRRLFERKANLEKSGVIISREKSGTRTITISKNR